MTEKKKKKTKRGPKRRLTDEPTQLVSLRARGTEMVALYQLAAESFFTVNGYVAARLKAFLRAPLTEQRIAAMHDYRDYLKKEPLEPHGLRLPKSLHDHLQKEVEKAGCSKNTFIRFALFGHLRLEAAETPSETAQKKKGTQKLDGASKPRNAKASGKIIKSPRGPKRRTFVSDKNELGRLSVRLIKEHDELLELIAASRFRSKNTALLSMVEWFFGEVDKGLLSFDNPLWDPAYDEAQSYKRFPLQFRGHSSLIQRIRDLIDTAVFPSANHFFSGVLTSYVAAHPEQLVELREGPGQE